MCAKERQQFYELLNYLPRDIVVRLEDASLVSIERIIKLPEKDLICTLRFNLGTVKLIKQAAAQVLLQSTCIVKASQLEVWNRLSTLCKPVDDLLVGGLPKGAVTEVYGAFGVGKTQLALQLALSVHRLGTDSDMSMYTSIYLWTEKIFPAQRFLEISRMHGIRYAHENIYVHQVHNVPYLLQFLTDTFTEFLSRRAVGIVVIDSIGALFSAFVQDGGTFIERHKAMVRAIKVLRHLASKYSFVVLCINQVRQNVWTGADEPCFGVSWANLLDYRLVISRQWNSSVRVLTIDFAPDLPRSSCCFKIDEHGLVDVYD